MELTRRKVALLAALALSAYALRVAVALALVVAWVFSDRLAGLAAGWAMKYLCPKHFDWSIEWILIRPNLFAGKSCPAEIVVGPWTWYNPPGFDSPYILKIEKIHIILDFDSIFSTLILRRTTAITISHIHLTGVRFCTERNNEDALNLWVALDLPDQDVNLVVNSLRGLNVDHFAQVNRPPPRSPVSPRRRKSDADRVGSEPQPTRWRSQSSNTIFSAMMMMGRSSDGRPPSQQPSPMSEGGSPVSSGCCYGFLFRKRERTNHQRQPEPEPPRHVMSPSIVKKVLNRRDTGMWDPRRRPRWGVPIRFDVESVLCSEVTAELMDMVTVHQHHQIPASTAIKLPFVEVTREGIKRGDPRREFGIYLGELVWSIILALILKILTTQPSRLIKNSTLAVAFGLKDVAHYTIARTLEMAINAPFHIDPAAMSMFRNMMPSQLMQQNQRACILVRLHCGRRLFAHLSPKGKKAIPTSTHVIALLYNNSHGHDRFVDVAISKVRLWTRRPRWDEKFVLGPIRYLETAKLKIIVIHHDRIISGGIMKSNTRKTTAAGEFDVPMLPLVASTLPSTAATAWFRLDEPTTATYSVLATNFKDRRGRRAVDGTLEMGGVLDDPEPIHRRRDTFFETATSKLRQTISNGSTRAKRRDAYVRRLSFGPSETIALLTGEVKLGVSILNPEMLETYDEANLSDEPTPRPPAREGKPSISLRGLYESSFPTFKKKKKKEPLTPIPRRKSTGLLSEKKISFKKLFPEEKEEMDASRSSMSSDGTKSDGASPKLLPLLPRYRGHTRQEA